MADMLVNLLKLPEDNGEINRLRDKGINIRRIQAYEISVLRRFIEGKFNEAWADEVMVAFSHLPVTCFVATFEKRIVGFGAYECTRRAFFGPTGVDPDYRGKGIGKALLLECLRGLRDIGYVYAAIGGVGPAEFYAKVVGAIPIPDSTPGVYVDGLERG